MFSHQPLPKDQERPAVTIILPVHNERGNLRALLDEICAALGNTSFEVIAIDDASTDGSGDLLRSLCRQLPYLRVLQFRRNYGQSAAFDAGFRNAKGRLIVTMDADLQNDPADIPRMIHHLNQHDLDFVIGNRSTRMDGLFSRTIPSKIANFIIRRVTGTKMRDLGCSLKVYRKEVARELRLYGEMHRFIAVLVEAIGARTGQIPVNHRARVSGTSKYGAMRMFKVLLDLLTVWFMRGYYTKPIYVFGAASAALFSGAVILSGIVLYEKYALGVLVHRNPLFILSMIMSVIAVQFLGSGLLAEIMVRTYYESQNKSAYVIRNQVGLGTDLGCASDVSGSPLERGYSLVARESSDHAPSNGVLSLDSP